MRAKRLRHSVGSFALLAAIVSACPALAAPSSAPLTPDKEKNLATATELAQKKVKPADERAIDAPAQAPKGGVKAAGKIQGAGSRPAIRGQKLPEEMRKRLEKQLDQRVDKDLKEIRALRAEAIVLLTTFVREAQKDTREMPEAMMRLGELLWENEREAFLDRFNAWEKKSEGAREKAPEPNYQPSRDLFAKVLKDYPNFPEYDLALYIDGFLATEQGKIEEAQARFTRILTEFPRSRFVPDAHMARAEALFGQKYDYAAALAEYEEVLKYPKSELYGLALFKSAWCLWRLGKSEEAAKRFVGVFEVTDEKVKASGAQRKALDELQSEALRYLVEVFTEDEKNTASDVYGFLTKIGGDRFAGKVVRALAVQFYDQAHYERGIEAYELLLRLEPASPEASQWVLQIANGYNTLENWPKLRATYERATAGYTAGSAWSRNQADPKTVEASSRAIEKQLREHTAQLHAKAQKDKTSRSEFEGAAGLYDVYLAKFGGEPGAYKQHFYAGEIHFHHLGKMTDAATHYLQAARTIPQAEASVEPGKTLRHDALYNAIAALETVRIKELETRKGPDKNNQETESDKKFAEALDLYIQLYPNDPALPELLFRQGKSYYDSGVYDPAVKIWGSLLEKFPKTEYARGAGELILDSFNRAKNYESIEFWGRRLKSAPAFASQDAQKRLDVLIVQAVFKQGEQKAQAGDHKGAAQAYLRAAREFPNDARAAQACVNAELAAQKAGDVGALKEAAQLVTGKAYKDKPEAPQGAWTAAVAFQSMGLLADSAEFHEAIAQSTDKDHPHYAKFEHARDAAYNAVLLREALGEHDKAVSNGQRYLALYDKGAEADEVAFQMGKAYQNASKPKEAADAYRRVAKSSRSTDRRAQALVFLAQVLMTSKDERGADQALKEAVALGKRRGELGVEGKYAVAHARYMEGERVLQRFDQITIQGDVKQLSQRLKQKAELLKSAAQIFLDTVSFGVAEWSTAALYQIGHTYESFAKALREAPPPSNLSDSDKEAYQQQIDEFVVPIEERSLDAYENGWKKATDLGIYNQWTAKMREALGRLNAELYPPFKEVGFEVRAQGPVAFPALLDSPRRGVAADAAGGTKGAAAHAPAKPTKK